MVNITLNNLMQTFSPYSNRWGGPIYRSVEIIKYINKHFFDKQIIDLSKKKRVDLRLISEAFLTTHHKPLYPNSMYFNEPKEVFHIKDQLGFETKFIVGTRILIYKNNEYVFENIENIKVGDLRVINMEPVKELLTLRLNHKFLSILPSNLQQILCDGINSNLLLRKVTNKIIKIRKEFGYRRNQQEIHLVKIIKNNLCAEKEISFNIDFLSFSYALKKDNSDTNIKSDYRYYKKIKEQLPTKYLNMLKSRIFGMIPDEYNIEMELIHLGND